MKEIGGEFWSVPVCEDKHTFFPKDTQWFFSGRSALTAIIRDIKAKQSVRTAALPSWCCESMVKPFTDEGVEVMFYPIWFDGAFHQDVGACQEADMLLVMDYFGYHNAPNLGRYRGIVIKDVTHSLFFDDFSHAPYCFGSLRKWCGVWTGGFAIASSDLSDKALPAPAEKLFLRESAMQEKQVYLSTGEGDKSFLATFADFESFLDDNRQVYAAADRDKDLAEHLDAPGIITARRKNAEVLMQELDRGKLTLLFPAVGEKDCPLFVPVLFHDRDRVKKALIEKGVYCPSHWPISEYHCLNEQTAEIYHHELSIVCDQRYDEEDMKTIAKLINSEA